MNRVIAWIESIVPLLGPPGLFLAAFLDSSPFMTLPEICDILMVTSSAARPGLTWLYALTTTAGSVAGSAVVWWLGRRGGEALLVRRFGEARVARTRALFDRWGVLTLAIPAVLPPPVPFKIFVLASGVFGMSLARMAATLFVARGLRFGFWGIVGAWYGERGLRMLRAAEPWLRAHGRPILAVVVIVAAVLVVRHLRKARASASPATIAPGAREDE